MATLHSILPLVLQPARRLRPAAAAPPRHCHGACVGGRAHTDEDPEAALDARLAKLRQAKGATPYNQGVKAKKAGASSEQAAPAGAQCNLGGPRARLRKPALPACAAAAATQPGASAGRQVATPRAALWADPAAPRPCTSAAAKPEYNWDGETVYYEGAPHRGDLAVNLALGITLCVAAARGGVV